MDNLFPNRQPSESTLNSAEQGNEPPWLSDVTRAAQHLTRLTLESSAQAALITRNDQLWAYAGQLPQSATSELTDTVSRYWDRQKENDLVRFVRLASTGAEHMLYATRLTQNMVLALIFDAETPFGTIHTQANQLVHSLSTSPTEKQEAFQESEEEAPSAPISDILSDIPSPNPQMDVLGAGLHNVKESNPAISLPPLRRSYFSRAVSPDIPTNSLPPTEETDPEIDLEKMVPSPIITRKNWFRRDVPSQQDPEATLPNSNNESARKIVLESASSSIYNLDYACLLIPRFPQHHLIGDLSDFLPGWMQEICISYEWRLEYISVRPDYLTWITSLPPAASPAYLMRIMIQRTSVKIFEAFPRFKNENTSGNFWTSVHLIMGRSQPPQAQLIRDFIAQTRQQQGIPPQSR
jgi:REP element-mobilizing transposase RayT